jgi:hypothetical protein
MGELKIFSTTVTPNASGALVQMYVSDAPQDAEDAAIRIALTAQVPSYALPLLVHVQRGALDKVITALKTVERNLAKELETNGRAPFATEPRYTETPP